MPHASSLALPRGVLVPVRVATTANVTSLLDGDIVDGVSIAVGDRVLLKDQNELEENGIWVAGQSGPPAIQPSRARDFADEWTAFPGVVVFVEEGSANKNRGFVVASVGTIDPGDSDITFTDVLRLSEGGVPGVQLQGGSVGSSTDTARADHRHPTSGLFRGLAAFYSDESTSSAGVPVDAFSSALPADTVRAEGDTLLLSYMGFIQGAAAPATRRVQAQFAGTTIFDTTPREVESNAGWSIDARLTCSSYSSGTASFRYSVQASIFLATGTLFGGGAVSGDLTGVAVNASQPIKLVLTASDAGAGVTAQSGLIQCATST